MNVCLSLSSGSVRGVYEQSAESGLLISVGRRHMCRRTERFRRQPAAPLDEGPSHGDFLPLLDSEDDISHANVPTRVVTYLVNSDNDLRVGRDRLPRTHHPHKSRRLNSDWKFRRSAHGPRGASLTGGPRFTAY